MRVIFILAAALPLLGPGVALAYCAQNQLPTAPMRVGLALPKPQPPARLFEEVVAPRKEVCCNPRNFECNPTRVPDTGLLPFEAFVDPPPGSPRGIPPLVCGHPGTRKFEAPARGLLRVEANPLFKATLPADPRNPRVLLKVLQPDGAVLVTYPCV